MQSKLVTKDGFLAILERIRAEAERDATLEGAMTYRAEGKGMFAVHAFIRTGNDMGQGGALLVQGKAIFVEGWTKAGRYARVEGDPYVDKEARVFVDDAQLEPTEVRRYRDGGTTLISTEKGTIIKPSAMKPGKATLDGEELEPVEPMG